MNKFKLSYYSVITDIIDENDIDQKRIIYSTRTGKALLIKNKTYNDISNGIYDNLSISELLRLTEMQLLVPENENELEKIMDENRVYLEDRKVLYHVLQPGANCQLGCHYCGQKHTKDFLPQNLYQSVIDRIEGKLMAMENQYKALTFTWYGAEPLMSLKQIRELTPLLKNLAKKYNAVYSSDMITNGLSLKKGIFEELVSELDVMKFQITLDGMQEDHDKRRYTKSGEKTFDIIMQNIINAVNHPLFIEKKCQMGVRINIDKTNQESVVPFLELLSSHNLLDKVILQFAEIIDWGENGASKDSLSITEFAEKEIDWILNFIQLGGSASTFIPERQYAACMVQEKNSEVFDAFGNIFPCYELPYTPIYENSHYLIGNLKQDENTYKLDNPLRNWSEHVKKGDVSYCNKCKFYPVCGGGCPKSWFDGTPACPSFKFNIEDRLVLQHISNRAPIAELL
ncbi:radical SAM protein [Chryseobacterium indologenes]|uniref:radical SAM/SPASM domain-containing protein n=1 Tax=Chryseobacterium indologenes TaxID=253 RepID=UPI0023E760AB|nr:radical SAM protein [Chryseobacterium indologenes]WET48133.1 radical SAM protein [Chryseobacterium indologenes]